MYGGALGRACAIGVGKAFGSSGPLIRAERRRMFDKARNSFKRYRYGSIQPARIHVRPRPTGQQSIAAGMVPQSSCSFSAQAPDRSPFRFSATGLACVRPLPSEGPMFIHHASIAPATCADMPWAGVQVGGERAMRRTQVRRPKGRSGSHRKWKDASPFAGGAD